MVPPSAWTATVFVGIVVSLVILLVAAVYRAHPAAEPPATRRRWALGTAVAAIVWLALTGGVAASGVLERTAAFPPPVMLFMLASMGVAVGAALSPLGTRLVRHAPIAALIGFQAFRLPLEIVLHAWWKEGVLPEQMTFEGCNFDIITGSLALVLGLWGRRRPLPRAAILTFNLIGTALLAIVAVVAMLSLPLPIRQFMKDPPVLLAFHVPTVWIVPFCVGGALFGHILVFRWLFGRAR